eukprot:6492092-Amphidinium_carterae.1
MSGWNGSHFPQLRSLMPGKDLVKIFCVSASPLYVPRDDCWHGWQTMNFGIVALAYYSLGDMWPMYGIVAMADYSLGDYWLTIHIWYCGFWLSTHRCCSD